jgi:beta-lactamase class D
MIFSTQLAAKEINFDKHFIGLSGCFILYDLNKNQIIMQYNSLIPEGARSSTDVIAPYFKPIMPQLSTAEVTYSPFKFATPAYICNKLTMPENQQIVILKSFVNDKKSKFTNELSEAKSRITLENVAEGVELVGKVGKGAQLIDNIVGKNKILQNNWFIGYFEKDKNAYMVVLNFYDVNNSNLTDPFGRRAKLLTEKILKEMKAFPRTTPIPQTNAWEQ